MASAKRKREEGLDAELLEKVRAKIEKLEEDLQDLKELFEQLVESASPQEPTTDPQPAAPAGRGQGLIPRHATAMCARKSVPPTNSD